MVTDNLEIAQDVLRFVNEMEEEQPNEIIAIYSKEMVQRQESFEVDLKIDWLGIDIVCGDSMLIEGIFNKPEWFADFIKHLNQYGLFDINNPIVYEYINFYNQLLEQGYCLEKFPKNDDGKLILDVIWVGVPKL